MSGQRDFMNKEVLIIKDSLLSIKDRQVEIIENAEAATKKAKTTKKNINDKLKQDEDAIDEHGVSDGELDDFLARFED